MFTMIGAAERAGSGIDKIKTGWNSQHWRSPIVREQMHPDRVIWVLPMLSLIPEKSLERLKDRFGSKFSKFSKLEIQALVTADVEGYVDNARMRQITGHHASDITKLLQDIVSRGILLQNGQGRWTQYCLPSDLDLNPLHTDDHSVHKGDHSVHKEEDFADQREALTKIAEPAKLNKRLSPKEMESIILQLCNDHWLTRKQISGLLQRNSDGLRSRFLTSMVEHGLLQLRYPDKPNRTDQAYKTTLPDP
jgi:ATP-dependent DNA helicase RecG